jgi:NADH-quinone oxidoreductase subunit A
MKYLLLTPPIAFIIIFVFSWLMSYFSVSLAYKRKGSSGALTKAYASGEDLKKHRVQPDYSQFFPFAFFFTILHVTALIITTSPAATLSSFLITVLYILGAILGLSVLFRREK